ncbi:MAG: hypothetical protein KJO07_08260, partial [Deltaproteobacteria bacterium]|nr:hypothetical protein [Deltaproteobacteria bacterium]
MRPLWAVLHLRPGEARRVFRIALIGAAYAAATSLGDDISHAVFVARAGAESLPTTFLFKAVLDIVAAAVYLPLTRGRSAARVWQVALLIYVLSVVAGGLWSASGTVAGGYGLFVLHESAWTILTIHWAVLILELFDANQARRLFPLLFAATRLGGIGAGAALQGLAGPTPAAHLLALCIGFALVAGLLTLGAKPTDRSQ